ncbi:hypothetical protein LX36DRAFT_653524 [Colletotrichum falcatum]|nr:hypothetical protein LX36DRAFT_653524 [Colletotrichum falcatum]
MNQQPGVRGLALLAVLLAVLLAGTLPLCFSVGQTTMRNNVKGGSRGISGVYELP